MTLSGPYTAVALGGLPALYLLSRQVTPPAMVLWP